MRRKIETKKYVFAIPSCKHKHGTDITIDYLPLIHLWFSSRNWILPFYTEKLRLRKASIINNSRYQFLRIECFFFYRMFEPIELHKLSKKIIKTKKFSSTLTRLGKNKLPPNSTCYIGYFIACNLWDGRI